ncbi:hypothetical protein D3C85_1602270 [compost metagenome]
MFRTAVKHLTRLIAVEPKFGRNHYLIAHRGQRFAHHLFVDVRAVDFGGIEECDAAINRRTDEGNGLRFVRRRAVTEA